MKAEAGFQIEVKKGSFTISQKKKPVLRIFRNRRKDVLLWTSLQYCSVSIKPNLSLHIYIAFLYSPNRLDFDITSYSHYNIV
jgi:hypothetical protein